MNDSEFFIIFLLEVYVRKTPSFFTYFASCQLVPDSGAWSILRYRLNGSLSSCTVVHAWTAGSYSMYSQEQCPQALMKVLSTWISLVLTLTPKAALLNRKRLASDDPLGLASDAVVEPYMYEPLASDSEAGGDDTSAVDDGDSDERLLDTNWYRFVVLYLNLSMIL